MGFKKRRQSGPERHKQSLGEQIEDPSSQGVRVKPHPHKRRKSDAGSEGEEEEEQFLPGELSSRILQEARLQQEELDAEDAPAEAAALGNSSRGALAAAAKAAHDSDSEEDDDFSEGGASGYGYEEEIEVNAEDEAALAAFMAPGAEDYQQRTLADLILERIRQHQEEKGLGAIPREGEEAQVLPGDMDPKVIAVYQGVGKLMSRYTAGKVPKAFKIIPNLQNWEEILYLTEPDGWSPHAVYQATRMFVSNLSQRMAQRFLALVLLPHVRRDIRDNRRLHFALFQSLRKATYKAGAFYKGLLLPLCASGSCTLREAVIFTSVIRRTSIPVLHSAAALLRIAELPYSGTNSFFIRVLLDKKYALPYRVVDALVDHFMRFSGEERALPVVWQQALLCFVQRYKTEIRREDKETLRRLTVRQQHYQLTPEILRELDSSRSRGERASGAEAMQAVSKVAPQTAENPRALAPLVLMED